MNDYLFYIILPLLSVALVIVFIRFYIGPSIVDRVVSLDLLITIGIGIITVYSIITKESTFLDVAMIPALIAFLGTVAFSFYLEKKGKNE